MALVIPADVDQFKTLGEKQFYHFLQSVGKPDTKHFAWYTPDIDGKGRGQTPCCSAAVTESWCLR